MLHRPHVLQDPPANWMFFGAVSDTWCPCLAKLSSVHVAGARAQAQCRGRSVTDTRTQLFKHIPIALHSGIVCFALLPTCSLIFSFIFTRFVLVAMAYTAATSGCYSAILSYTFLVILGETRLSYRYNFTFAVGSVHM